MGFRPGSVFRFINLLIHVEQKAIKYVLCWFLVVVFYFLQGSLVSFAHWKEQNKIFQTPKAQSLAWCRCHGCNLSKTVAADSKKIQTVTHFYHLQPKRFISSFFLKKKIFFPISRPQCGGSFNHNIYCSPEFNQNDLRTTFLEVGCGKIIFSSLVYQFAWQPS